MYNLVFYPFKSVNHLEITKEKVNLVSYSSAYFNEYLINLPNYSIAKSSSILTYQQVTTKEKASIILSLRKEYFKFILKLKEEIKENKKILYFYNTHNIKMTYDIMQYSSRITSFTHFYHINTIEALYQRIFLITNMN